MSPPSYRWRTAPGFAKACTASEALVELKRIRTSSGGILRTADIVREAQDRASPLHECFEWDDAIAGDEYRKWQARQICRSIELVRSARQGGAIRPVFLNVQVVDEEPETRGYIERTTALRDEELREKVLQDGVRRLRSWRRMFEDLPEFEKVFQAIDETEIALGYDEEAGEDR